MKQTEYFLYLWQNSLGRTCFGITGHPENRRRKYEGHTGHPVEFTALWSGPENVIVDIEKHIKEEFWEHLFNTSIGKYEWVNEDIAYDTIKNWIQWEIDNTCENTVQLVV